MWNQSLKSDNFAFGVAPLQLLREEFPEKSSVATGFFWKHSEINYIITNWHVVTGINPEKNEYIGTFSPNLLNIGIKTIIVKNGDTIVISSGIQIPLLIENNYPIWIEHEKGNEIDCVAIPFEFPKKELIANRPINEFTFHSALEPVAGMDCFVIGYPKGLSGRGQTPVWKRASIATEPALDHEFRPIYLIDTATREGMSGSPVIVRHSGIYGNNPDGKLSDDTVIGTIDNFGGIYSGRVGDDPLGVQLGRVWKPQLIHEILEAQIPGKNPALLGAKFPIA